MSQDRKRVFAMWIKCMVSQVDHNGPVLTTSSFAIVWFHEQRFDERKAYHVERKQVRSRVIRENDRMRWRGSLSVGTFSEWRWTFRVQSRCISRQSCLVPCVLLVVGQHRVSSENVTYYQQNHGHRFQSFAEARCSSLCIVGACFVTFGVIRQITSRVTLLRVGEETGNKN